MNRSIEFIINIRLRIGNIGSFHTSPVRSILIQTRESFL